MKSLLLGVLALIILGVGGFLYRSALEHPAQQIACPLDARMCPDGTSVARTGPSCSFPECPPPNVSLPNFGISFAVPEGFESISSPDDTSIAAFGLSSDTSSASIIIRRYPIPASTTPLTVIQQTAIGGASGLPVPVTAFTSTTLGTHRFTVVSLERFEGVVDTAFYLARGTDVLRFDAIDTGVLRWMDSSLDASTLPANIALRKLLRTLQGE